MKNDGLVELLERLNSESCYFVIRDYETYDRIANSKDIDIYVPKREMRKVAKILKENGWHRYYIIENKIAHTQYFKIINRRIMKIDIVTQFYYGKNSYSFKNRDAIIPDGGRPKSGAMVATPIFALRAMVLHIVYDKGEISEKNLKILKGMLDEYNGEKDYFWEVANAIVSRASEKEKIDWGDIREGFKKSGLLRSNCLLNCIVATKNAFCKYVGRIMWRLRKNSIAIVGVDGSGKSTAINYLSDIYGDKSRVVYMGLKDFKNNTLQKLACKKYDNLSLVEKIKMKCLLFFELLGRYYRWRFSRKVILFDRYKQDYYLNSIGKFKIIDNVIYRLLFPNPKKYIYVYCKTETSFSRKDDIEDKKGFAIMKKRYDSYFLKKQKVLLLNTDKMNEEQVIDKITEYINTKMYKSLF